MFSLTTSTLWLGLSFFTFAGKLNAEVFQTNPSQPNSHNKPHGLVLALEHRYYGKSLPFGADSLSVKNLKYLSAEQALKDLAYFLTKMSKSGQYKITPKNPWITIGGSYPGALSAWFRNKYPHLTIGALASSGVVLAV
jgi:hypothetical protein